MSVEKVKKFVFKFFKWLIILVALAFIARFPFYIEKKDTEAEVERIHSIRLTMDDVMGVNLPPDPGEEADDTIEGIDANQNGIRDDVELAIFEKYPDSAKTRAPLLQYALIFQDSTTQKIVNEDTVTQLTEELSRADRCISDTLVPGDENAELFRTYADIEKIDEYIDFIEDLQLNTYGRKISWNDFLRGKLGGIPKQSDTECDIDQSLLEK